MRRADLRGTRSDSGRDPDATFSREDIWANVPPEAFAAATERVARLLAVGIGVSQVERADDVRATVRAVRAVDPDVPVIIGGVAAAELETLVLEGVSAYARDGAEALRVLEATAPRRAIRRVV